MYATITGNNFGSIQSIHTVMTVETKKTKYKQTMYDAACTVP